MIRLFPYPIDQFDESQSYGAFFRKKGRGLPNAYVGIAKETYRADVMIAVPKIVQKQCVMHLNRIADSIN